MLQKTALPALPDKEGAISSLDVQRIEADTISALPFVSNISEADEWRRRAKAIEAYLRSPEMQRPMLSAQRHIEARIGQLLGPAEHGGDRRSDQVDHGQLDLDRHTCADFRLMARALDLDGKIFESSDWRKSRRAFLKLIRWRFGLLPEAPELPLGKYRCIVADPPWQQDTGPEIFNGSGESGHDALAYEQLTVDQICALTDKAGRHVMDCAADDAHLYLWTINKYVEASYRVARAWGFKPSVLLTWCKTPRGVGLGDTFRLTTEAILFCRRGSLDHKQIIPTTWFQWPRGKHSKKPDAFYAMVESVTPGPNLELFAREKRKRWKVWGDEIV